MNQKRDHIFYNFKLLHKVVYFSSLFILQQFVGLTIKKLDRVGVPDLRFIISFCVNKGREREGTLVTLAPSVKYVYVKQRPLSPTVQSRQSFLEETDLLSFLYSEPR